MLIPFCIVGERGERTNLKVTKQLLSTWFVTMRTTPVTKYIDGLQLCVLPGNEP